MIMENDSNFDIDNVINRNELLLTLSITSVNILIDCQRGHLSVVGDLSI